MNALVGSLALTALVVVALLAFPVVFSAFYGSRPGIPKGYGGCPIDVPKSIRMPVKAVM